MHVRRHRTTLGSPLHVILNVTGPGFSQMNENALGRISIPADDSRLRANWRAVHAFNRANSNQINKKMKTLIRSVNRSPMRCGFFTLAIALCWFALSPPLKAQDCPSTCPGGGNTGLGPNALDSVTGGINNTAVGANALTSDTTGAFNVAIGSGALRDNTSGFQNMAIGAEALANNITGNFNMAIGFRALNMNTGGRNSAVGAAALRNNAGASDNTAIGSEAMRENTSGEQNTAVGRRALEFLLTGSNNTIIGWRAGDNYTSNESSNIVIGSGIAGTAGEDNTIRIGTNLPSSGINISCGGLLQAFTIGSGFAGGGIQYLQFFGQSISIASGFSTVNGNSSCFIGGIFNQTPTAGSHLVSVGIGGKLADATLSSRRFKKDIAPIDKISEGILALKPVTFHWKTDNTNEPEFGLVAEDVAEVNLDWITRNPQGEISGVRYETIPILLLNEFLKEHKKVEEQQANIADLKSTVALQQKDMQILTAQLKEQAAQIQKVSAQLEASKPAPKVVTNR